MPRHQKLDNIFRTIDSNLTNFYSSKTNEPKSGQCSCKTAVKEKLEQLSFYSAQKNMISEAGKALVEERHSEDEHIVGKILLMVIDYINKIIELLNKDYLCQCKQIKLADSLVMKHKIQFMREENDKFFRLCQEKSAECQRLMLKIQGIKNDSQIDVRPITTRQVQNDTSNKENGDNESISLGSYPSSCNLSEEKSYKSSKISENQGGITEVKETVQRDHNWYFMKEISRKSRKNKIFNENI